MNLTALGQENTQPTSSTSNSITLDMGKNNLLDLTKSSPSLTKIKVGAGWDVSQSGQTMDLDIMAILLHQNDKVTSSDDIIFFNQQTASGIYLEEDNRTGAGEGDDEKIFITLSDLDPTVQKIVFAVVIFDAVAKNQTFGMVKNAYIRVVDTAVTPENEMAIFPLTQDYSSDTAVIFGELAKNASGGWDFKTIGEGKVGNINDIASLYN